MALNGINNEEKIWNYLYGKIGNSYGVAGLMGNLYAESGLNSANLENTKSKKLGLSDAEYTAMVDDGSYTNFIKDSSGYGLAQWTYWTRKKSLLEFSQSRGSSIGDLEMQLEFLWMELSGSFSGVLNVLKTAESVLEASNAVLFNFERPANQGVSVQQKRAEYGQVYFDKFAVKEEDIMAEIKKDNTPDVWAKEAVEWAVKNKILFGDENGNYKLHDNCTRQEMLVFLNRMYKLMK